MNSDSDASWMPPPLRPKRKNVVLRLFDTPVYRDFTIWATVGMGTLAGFAIGSSESPSGIPVWVNTLLAIGAFASIFGILPAALRLQYRRWMWRRRMSQQPPPSSSAIGASLIFAETAAQAGKEEINMDAHGGGSVRVRSTGTSNLLQVAPSMSQVLAHAHVTLQYPVALAVRKLQLATSQKERYEALLDSAESLILTLGVTSAAWLRSEKLGKGDLEGLRNQCAHGGLSQGHWQAIIRSFATCSIGHPHPLLGALGGFRKSKGGLGLEVDLSALTTERNRSAHGGRPRTDGEASSRLSEFLPVLERALDKAMFLAETPWVITQSSSYQRRSGNFDVQAELAMGDHPDFRSQKFTSGSPLANENFYALGPTGPVDLTPFVVRRYCDTCHDVEIFYVDRLDEKKGLLFRSFGRGHVTYDQTLDEEIRSISKPG